MAACFPARRKGDDASPPLTAFKVVFSRSLVQLRRGLLASALGAKISTWTAAFGPRSGHALARSPLGRGKQAASMKSGRNPPSIMKPNVYYRRPDLLVGLTDKKGRFSCAVGNQLIGESEFNGQRLTEAVRQLRRGRLSAIRLMHVADYWRVSPSRLLKLIRKGA
jgi:hypothetical protein